MRPAAALSVLLVAIALVLVVVPAAEAGKGNGGNQYTVNYGGSQKGVKATIKSTSKTTGTTGTTPTSSTSTSGGVPQCHDASGAVEACSYSAGGYDFSASSRCGGYAAVVASSAAGTLYSCDPTACTAAMLANPQTAACGFWVANGKAAPPVNPAVLARTVVKRMRLVRPTMNMSPAPPLMTYVGLATWLWIDAGQWRTLKLTASLRGTTVTVTAAPSEVYWNLTEGGVNCHDSGSVWRPGLPKGAKSTCSYTFQHTSDFQPTKAFPVSAVIDYAASWTCKGRCTTTGGELGNVEGPTAHSAIRVGEIETVNR